MSKERPTKSEAYKLLGIEETLVQKLLDSEGLGWWIMGMILHTGAGIAIGYHIWA